MTYSEKRFGVSGLALFGALMIASALGNTALAANSVTVGSATVLSGKNGITIPIKIENDVPLRAFVIPLVIREVSGGAYITSLRLQFTERVNLVRPSNVVSANIRQVDGSCGADGLGTILFSGEDSHPVSSPVGLLMSWTRTSGIDLAPGADASGSILLTVDIALPDGVFEIDVSCADPSSVLTFIDDNLNTITPTFQKGTITVTPTSPTNFVRVGSATVVAGQTGVTIPIKIENDVPLLTFDVPLVIREISGGAYITSLQLQWSERMSPIPGGVGFTQISQIDGSCGVDGMGTVMFNDQNDHSVSSPVGVFMAWIDIAVPPFPAGADISGSILLTFDVDLPVGVFEIDASCADFGHTLRFLDETTTWIYPTFEPGIITVIPNCCDTPGDANDNGTTNIADAIYIIGMVFNSGPTPPCCNQGDSNGNGAMNIADAIYIINTVFNSGPAPICGPAGMGC